jgi:type IV secretion system protein TrbL
MSGISLTDVGFQWFRDILDQVVEWFVEAIVNGYRNISEALFGTPVPETANGIPVGEPQNQPWTQLYDALVAGEVTLIAFLILLICVQGRHTLRIFNLSDPVRDRRVRRSAWTGGMLIVIWYWLAVTTLFLVDGFSIALVPSIESVTTPLSDLFDLTLSNPLLSLWLSFFGALAMWTLQALLYLRELLLYVFVYTMPIAIAVAYGGLPVLSGIAARVAVKFIPLAVMPLPVALLFRGYDLLIGGGAGTMAPESPFFGYLIAVSLPVVSVWVIWKLFAYTTPRLVRTVGRVTGLTVTAGAVAGAATVAGPWAGAAAARWGPKAAAGQAVAQRFGRDREETASTADSSAPVVRTNETGAPSYRRTENEPRP